MLLYVCSCFVSVLDLLLLPLYSMFYKNRPERRREWGWLVPLPGSLGITTPLASKISVPEVESLMASCPKIKTMADFFEFCVDKHSFKRCLGSRAVISQVKELGLNGNLVSKNVLGDYNWKSFIDVNDASTQIGNGFTKLGLVAGDKICIFAETRVEWMETALACFKNNFAIVTLYPNLGDDAVIHAINQTKPSVLVTSKDICNRFSGVLGRIPGLETLILMDDDVDVATSLRGQLSGGARVLNYKEVLQLGKNLSGSKPTPPKPSDTAIIMYTSGSTGVPKGVVLPHSALVATVLSYPTSVGSLLPDDVYIGYLPLAHILEMLAECCMMLMGTPIGYSSPTTLTDKSTNIPKGCRGDSSVLKPTIMFAVPVILDKIRTGITEKINSSGWLFGKLFDACLAYKIHYMRQGLNCPILDALLFRRIRLLVGGRVRLMLCGGAALSPHTHEFVRAAMGVPVAQGYGLTETCSAACLMDLDDTEAGHVGPPLPGVSIRITEWLEGDCRIDHKDGARGEIEVGGEGVAKGYYNLPEATKEAFYTDEGGVRWCRTGDIGQILPGGKIKIIDRKKDLVKLQHGEYVSLGRVETILKTHSLVENICVYGDPLERSLVALVVPTKDKLKALMAAMKLEDTEELSEEMSEKVTREVVRQLRSHGAAAGLTKFELISNLMLVAEEWTPESGFVTATFKLRRKVIQQKYQESLNQLYL